MRLIILLICLFLNACGYTFQGGGSVLPKDVKNIYIPTAENNTSEVGLAQVVTEALRDRFDRYGVVFVVDKLSDADAMLKTKILNIKRDTSSSSAGTDVALQYNTQLILSAELKRVTGQALWQNGEVTAEKTFGTASNLVVTSSADFSDSPLTSSDLAQLDTRELSRGQEKDVLEDLAEAVALKVYNQAVLPDF